MFEFSVSKDMKENCRQLQQMRYQRVGRWIAIPKSASLVKSMLHMEGGGSTREGSGTHLRLALFVKELKIIVEQARVVTTLNVIKH